MLDMINEAFLADVLENEPVEMFDDPEHNLAAMRFNAALAALIRRADPETPLPLSQQIAIITDAALVCEAKVIMITTDTPVRDYIITTDGPEILGRSIVFWQCEHRKLLNILSELKSQL
jgi:hypothetical protein